MEYISQNLTTIIIAIVGLFAAGVVVSFSIRSLRNKNSNNDNSTRVNQQGNIAGGDIVGRDKKNNR